MITTVTLNPAIDKIFQVDNFSIHKLHRQWEEEKARTTPGGKGVNIAINLFRLGKADTIAMGFAGGHPGRMLVEMIREEGVATNFIYFDGSTRQDVSILDTVNNTLTEVNESGKTIDPESFDLFMDNYRKRMNHSRIVAIGGSIPYGNDKEIYGDLVKIAHKENVKTLVHTSPKNIQSAIEAGANIIAPDMRSHHSFQGKEIDSIEEFLKKGKELVEYQSTTELVIFCHRVENIVAVTREGSYILRPDNLKIINMLGYGDAIMAGIIQQMHDEKSMEDSLIFGAAAGLTNIESISKQLEDFEEVKKNIPRIKVEKRSN